MIELNQTHFFCGLLTFDQLMDRTSGSDGMGWVELDEWWQTVRGGMLGVGCKFGRERGEV
jgi:hypothetical protein